MQMKGIVKDVQTSVSSHTEKKVQQRVWTDILCCACALMHSGPLMEGEARSMNAVGVRLLVCVQL